MGARKSKAVSDAQSKAAPRADTSRALYFYATAALLSLIGLGDAVYLTVKHLKHEIVPCTITGGCEQVLNSSYATIGGIPLALIGALGYFTVFSLATLAAFGNAGARTLLFYLVLLMLAISIWLFLLQALVIHAYCQFCLLSGAITLLLSLVVLAQRFLPKFKHG